MTTTVYDRESKIIAADTRWSVCYVTKDGDNLFAYTDDSNFEKIADRQKATMLMAGNGKVIADWKRWWFESLDIDNMPRFEIDGKTAIVLLIVNKETNKWIFDIGEKVASICSVTEEINAVFCGSGSGFAAQNWTENRCAKTAIIEASKKDISTSGIVKFVDFKLNETNIGEPSYNYTDILTALTQGGYIMSITDQNVIPLKEHKLAAEICQSLSSGQIVASAPTPELSRYVWSEERKSSLKSAIQKVRVLEGLE